MTCVCVCVVSLARIFSTMLNRSGKVGYPCLILDLKGKAFRFSPLSMLAVGFFIYGPYNAKYYTRITHMLLKSISRFS